MPSTRTVPDGGGWNAVAAGDRAGGSRRHPAAAATSTHAQTVRARASIVALVITGRFGGSNTQLRTALD
jgi:hypothetical protein